MRSPGSRRGQAVGPFHVMDLLAQARRAEAEGRDIVHMEIGEPDFPAPEPVLEAAKQALAEGRTHYTPAAGIQPLREAIAGFYRQRHGLEIDSSRIIVTPGSSGALQLVMTALLDPRDEVLMADPGYPCNRHIAGALGATAVTMPVDAATDYQPTPEQIAEHWNKRTRAVLLASPSNPCGSVLEREPLRRLAASIEDRDGWLVMDEIYHGLVYGADAPSALQVSDRCFVINSFSKYFGMTGFRIGWLVAPPEFVPMLDRLAQNLFLAVNTPAQYAALAAFSAPTIGILEQRRSEFEARRDFLLPAVRSLGFEVPIVPRGAFYLYAGSAAHSDDSLAFTQKLLKETGVVITPGVDFGTYHADRHVRFSYTTGRERLAEGIERLQRYLGAGG